MNCGALPALPIWNYVEQRFVPLHPGHLLPPPPPSQATGDSGYLQLPRRMNLESVHSTFASSSIDNLRQQNSVQGGVMNHGLLFSGPLPPQSWVREPQKCRNPIGYGPSSGINIAGGVGRASVAMDHACRQLIAKKLRAAQHHRHICSELRVSRSLVFKIKKLQDDG